MRSLTVGTCRAVAITLAFVANVLIDAALYIAPPGLDQRRFTARDDPRPLDAQRLSTGLATPLRPRAAQPPARPLPLKLLGTLDDYAAAMADAASGQCRTMRPGDRWGDVELVAVGHGRVTLRRAGALEELAVGATGAPVTGASAFPISFTARGASLAMARAELLRQLPDLVERALAGGRIVPAFESGTVSGFRLVAVRPGSLYEELGLKTGDVLEAVNGAPLSNPDVAFGLMARLRDQPKVALVVNRAGQRLTWELSLN